jgi:PPM family protein phosphatase
MGANALFADVGAVRDVFADSQVAAGSDTPMLAWELACVSDAGHERAHNEDACAIDARNGLILLADGMGGYNAGEVASALAIEHASAVLRHHIRRELDLTAQADTVRHAIAAANAAILAAAARRPECLGMGTTLVAASVGPRILNIGHVGDSRAYLYRSGHLARLTHDHSVGQAMIDAGVLDEQTVRLSTLRGVLTRALGVESRVDVDLCQIEWFDGDRLLFCSDGLTDMVGDSDIAAILAGESCAQAGAQRLTQAALDAGGHDNISVIIACCRSTQRHA